MALVGWSSLSIAQHTGPGRSEIGVPLSLDDGGLLNAEIAPPAPPAETPLPALGPVFSQPAPAVDRPSTPLITVAIAPPPILPTAPGLPREIPTILPSVTKRGTSHAAVSATEAKSTSRGGGLAGAGQGRREGAEYTPPRFLLRYKPTYPAPARAQKLEGTVLLLVSVDAAGHVAGASLQRSCGHTILDRAALEAVRSWRFVPAYQADRAVPATVEVPIRFTFST